MGRKIFWAGLLLAQFILFYLMSYSKVAVSFFESFFEQQKNGHLSLFASLAFSVGDLFYTLLSVGIIIIAVFIFKKHTRQRAPITLLIALNILYFSYQFFWGMLYFQTPLIDKIGQAEPSKKAVQEITEQFLQKCIETRRQVSEDQHGVFEIKNLNKIRTLIIRNQQNLPQEITTKNPTRQISIKPSLFKNVLSYTGISGYYNPFTAEAQYNSMLPHANIPATIAHETAHQLGFAREQEASFIGYLLGRNSSDLDLRYSTQYFALKSLMRSFPEKDSLYVKDVRDRFSEPMKRDLQAEKDFAMRHAGVLDVFFGITNNLFLKSNQQEGSITYSYFVELLVRYEMAQKKESRFTTRFQKHK